MCNWQVNSGTLKIGLSNLRFQPQITENAAYKCAVKYDNMC